MKKHLKLMLSVAILLFSVAGVSLADNATPIPPQTQGITITPAFQQISIPQGADQQPVNFSVTNNEHLAQTLDLSAADFNTLNETGGLLFVGSNPTDLQKKYGLAKWISLPQKQITLAPGQTETIDASILNLPSLTSGGHYGALMLSSAGASSKQNSVTLHPIASSLLFVTKLGGDTHKLSLSKVDINHSLFKLPGSVTLRFHNDGNSHLIPRGTVTISNSNNKLISKGIINDNSGIILPSTFRRYYVPLQTVQPTSVPGRYVVKVDFRFDGISQFREYKQSFTFIPSGTIFIIAILLIVAIFLFIKFFKRYISKFKE